jgi:hypothetical protein
MKMTTTRRFAEPTTDSRRRTSFSFRKTALKIDKAGCWQFGTQKEKQKHHENKNS